MRVALSRRLVLEAPRGVPDGAGGRMVSWVALGTLWAEVSPERPRLAVLPGATLATVPLCILVRAAPPGAPSRPVMGQRFREGARLYPISAVREADAEGRYLACAAVEEAAS